MKLLKCCYCYCKNKYWYCYCVKKDHVITLEAELNLCFNPFLLKSLFLPNWSLWSEASKYTFIVSSTKIIDTWYCLYQYFVNISDVCFECAFDEVVFLGKLAFLVLVRCFTWFTYFTWFTSFTWFPSFAWFTWPTWFTWFTPFTCSFWIVWFI